MAYKSYGVENMAYDDPSRTNDYNLEIVEGASTYVMPANMAECSYMFPSQIVEILGSDALRELDKETS